MLLCYGETEYLRSEPIETEESTFDFSKLTLEEKLQLEALLKKARGLPPGIPGVIDFTPCSPRTVPQGPAKDQEGRASKTGS